MSLPRCDALLSLPDSLTYGQNWQWDGVVDDLQGPRDREPAWLRLTAGDRSSISYVMPMVAGPKGYEPIFEVHLDTIAVTSGLNDIRLVSAESCRVCFI